MNSNEFHSMLWHSSLDEIGLVDNIKQFAKLAIAAEREACAKICEEFDSSYPRDIAERIRSRKDTI